MTRAKKRANGSARDQAPSTFARILTQLVFATPGAAGAALVDFEGETVDYAGSLEPFDLKVAAAHWQLVLAGAETSSDVGPIQQFSVRAQRRGYFVRRLYENYAIVIVLHPRAAFAVSERALVEATVGLSREAGWPAPCGADRWYAVEVDCDRQGKRWRPLRVRVEDAWQPVEIMGALMGLDARESGYRVRLESGAEVMLIRERLGHWFSDEHL